MAQIEARYGDAGCLMCAVLADPLLSAQQIHATPTVVTIASRYPLIRGHLLVVARAHVESVASAPASVWGALCAEAQRVSGLLEARLAPARVWVASLGSVNGSAPMSCAHLHLHVLPVPEPTDRPTQVLTWKAGVLDTDADWWRADVAWLRAQADVRS